MGLGIVPERLGPAGLHESGLGLQAFGGVGF